ncbi:hypothetical protein DF185_02545 [Marinifilum breve]|uniref:ATP-grasp domain-containing protein n=1 Tax=Marinifilum breve TaxID=2184082 RepID=A0A2V4A2U9_9BACT|nr:ATP-grasp domain-containing protein [Marinifilum breve]PXY02991.1 hypothetical protein DF185_02545 [Marinifilum breve]
MSKRILILGAGEMQVPIIRKSRDMGLYTIVADYDPNAPGFKYADLTLEISTIDFDAVLSAAKKYQIDGILTTSDYPVKIVAKVSEELKLKSMSTSVATTCTNKYIQRQFFKENNIPSPFYQLISSEKELVGIDRFPLIIKPVDSSASRGVRKVKDFTELQDQYPISKEFSKNGGVLIEEYIEGNEYSIETFSQNGQHNIIAITEKRLIQGNDSYFVESAHILPALLREDDESLIKTTVLNLLNKLNVDNCPCHVELKLNAKGVFIIEIACRLGGDYITSNLVPLATGIDMLGNLINVSLGNEISIINSNDSIAAVQFINGDNYNNSTDFIENYSSYVSESCVKDFHNREIENSLDRMGFIILSADNHDKLSDLLIKIN